MPHAESGANAPPGGSPVLLEARRRRKYCKPWRTHDSAAQYHGGQSALVEQIARDLLEVGVDQRIGVGPLVARPAGAATATPPVYFIVVAADEGGLFTLLAGGADSASAADLRDAVVARLLWEGPPITVRAFDDELELAIWAARQWPDDREATTLVTAITAERRRG
jgi:hypothetical protein